MSQETILVTGASGGVGSTAHTAIAILLEQYFADPAVTFR
jgi:NADPH:quinone reductase-like Zn-dependent oxidoreductase